MKLKFLREHNIFILVLLTFLGSCQLTTNGEKKSVLDEDLSIEDEEQVAEKEVLAKEEIEDISKEIDTKTVDEFVNPVPFVVTVAVLPPEVE